MDGADLRGPGNDVGVVETEMTQPQRRKEYGCDVTYGTAKEFGVSPADAQPGSSGHTAG